MPEGVVAWFDNDKGFGFLTPDDGGADVFVHLSGLVEVRSLVQGQRVGYELTQGSRGPQGVQVRQLGGGGRSAGTVSWFDVEKGFGFLAPDDGGADVFVHVSEIADDEGLFALDPGERVEYELAQGERGPQARDVRPAGGRAPRRDSRAARMVRASGGGRSSASVAWFDAERGFGFLAPDEGGPDVFVHWKAISSESGFRTLSEGQRVDYERTTGERGPQALDVRVVD